MVRCQVLDDGVELGGSQSLDRGSFRPNLEDVRWTVHLRSTAERGTDDPGRHVQQGVFGIHLPGVVLELARVAGLGSEDEERHWRPAVVARDELHRRDFVVVGAADWVAAGTPGTRGSCW